MLNEEVKEVVSATKAEKLSRAIARIDNVSFHAEKLLSLIVSGEEEIAVPSIDPVVHSLSDLLTNGPDEIDKLCDKAHSVLDNIQETLF